MSKVTSLKNIPINTRKFGNCFAVHLKLFLALFLAASIFSSNLSAQVAQVDPPSGGFHIDGGLRANTPTANIGDWYPGAGGTGGSVFTNAGVPISPATVQTSGKAEDPFNSNDNIFTTGSKFNDYIGDLSWFTNSAPDKNDINNALYHVSRDGSNNQWIFISGDRLSTNGTSYIDFELLQGTVVRNGTTSGGFTGTTAAGKTGGGGRTENDIIISMEYTNGGSKPNVYIYQWKLSGGKWSYQLVTGLSGLATNAFAETNRTGAENNLPYTAFGTATYQQFAFVEAAVNITYLLNQTGLACSGLNIQTLWVKTKASASSTAALKDFMDPIPVNFTFGNSSINPISDKCANDNNAYLLSATPTGGTFTGPGVSQVNGSYYFTPSAAGGAGTKTINYSASGCNASTTITVTALPAAPTVNVVNNCDGSSDLTATNYTGTLLWSNGATTASINVTNAATYSVTQTVNGCTSAPGSGTSAPKTTPGSPTVGVVDNCDGTSTLTASNYTGTLLWSTGETTASITVNSANTYTVTQTLNGCTSVNGSGTAAPKTTPNAPIVTPTNNCNGTTTLAVSGIAQGATITWIDDATNHENPRTVSVAGQYSITQSLNGCTSAEGSGTAAPKTVPPAPSVTYNAPACDQATFTVTVNGPTANAVYSILDKNGNVIPGVTKPDGAGDTYTAPNTTSFNFGNIPAGSGYKVSVSNNGCASTPANCGIVTLRTVTTESAVQQSAAITQEIELKPQPNITATPNPFTTQVKFSLKSFVSGRGTLELYNLLGQKVQTVFDGYVEAGRVKNIEYNAPGTQSANLLYVFKVGDQKVTGKLIKLR
jgi:hypothetical protein